MEGEAPLKMPIYLGLKRGPLHKSIHVDVHHADCFICLGSSLVSSSSY